MPPPKLPDAEADVLAVLYDGGEATAREVRKALARRRPLTHASVATLLGRLEARGYVSHRKGPVGKAFVYRATKPRPRAFAAALERLLRHGFGGSSSALIASLFETRPPTPDELEEIRVLVRSRSGQTSADQPKGRA